MRDRPEAKEEELSAAITGLERQRATLGDAVVDSAIAALRRQLAQLKAEVIDRPQADERKVVTIAYLECRLAPTACTLSR